LTRIIGVIPARMGSTRFPGKPLAPIRGVPMLEHVYRRVRGCALLDEVYIATCDDAIARAARAIGAQPVMTAATHERASDRVAEIATRYEADVVVMIQGDEPLIRPEMIDSAVAPMLRDSSINCVNLVGRIRSENELRDRNTIKVVTARDGRALYFSREPIPGACGRAFGTVDWRKQVCVIPFRRHALLSFARLPHGSLEELESIDMLRFLENGLAVHTVPTDCETHAVDVPADVPVVAEMMAHHPWPGDGRPSGAS
jgi:3-deoxy-manno-octulosonate cytidylyltransferase (CMP-KDO synthetase)